MDIFTGNVHVFCLKKCSKTPYCSTLSRTVFLPRTFFMLRHCLAAAVKQVWLQKTDPTNATWDHDAVALLGRDQRGGGGGGVRDTANCDCRKNATVVCINKNWFYLLHLHWLLLRVLLLIPPGWFFRQKRRNAFFKHFCFCQNKLFSTFSSFFLERKKRAALYPRSFYVHKTAWRSSARGSSASSWFSTSQVTPVGKARRRRLWNGKFSFCPHNVTT